jgi:threonine/homoserine/homoserine lactone efflux protein
VSLEFSSVVAFCGVLASSLWSLWLGRARRAGWFNILCGILIAIASVLLLWTAAEFHLLSFGTNF